MIEVRRMRMFNGRDEFAYIIGEGNTHVYGTRHESEGQYLWIFDDYRLIANILDGQVVE